MKNELVELINEAATGDGVVTTIAALLVSTLLTSIFLPSGQSDNIVFGAPTPEVVIESFEALPAAKNNRDRRSVEFLKKILTVVGEL